MSYPAIFLLFPRYQCLVVRSPCVYLQVVEASLFSPFVVRLLIEALLRIYVFEFSSLVWIIVLVGSGTTLWTKTIHGFAFWSQVFEFAFVYRSNHRVVPCAPRLSIESLCVVALWSCRKSCLLATSFALEWREQLVAFCQLFEWCWSWRTPSNMCFHLNTRFSVGLELFGAIRWSGGSWYVKAEIEGQSPTSSTKLTGRM